MSNILKIAGAGVSAAAEETDPNFNQTVLLLHGDGTNGAQNNTFLDSGTANGGSGFTITRNGNVTQGSFSPFGRTSGNLDDVYDPAVNGGSGYFDGIGGYLSLADNAAFTLGSSDFTIEAWVYWTGSGTQTISGQVNSAANGGLSYLFRTNASGYLRGTVWVNTTGYEALSSNVLPTNQWVHAAFVRDTNTTRIYINGVQDGTDDVTGITVNDSAEILSIGRPGAYDGNYWSGYISNFRQVVGTCLYPNGTTFTPSTSPLTTTSQGATSSEVKLLLNFTNAGIFDNTGKNNLETVGNAQIDTTTKQFGTGSIEFDGAGDYLTEPNNVNYHFGSGDFTIEFWANTTSFGTQRYTPICGIWSVSPTPTDSNSAWYVSINAYDNTKKLGFSYRVTGSNTDVAFGSTTNGTGTWDHYAVVRSGNLLYGFKNGTLLNAGGTSITATLFTGGTVPFRVGNIVGGNEYNGFIDDLRITKGVARTITVPTKAYPDL